MPVVRCIYNIREGSELAAVPRRDSAGEISPDEISPSPRHVGKINYE